MIINFLIFFCWQLTKCLRLAMPLNGASHLLKFASIQFLYMTTTCSMATFGFELDFFMKVCNEFFAHLNFARAKSDSPKSFASQFSRRLTSFWFLPGNRFRKDALQKYFIFLIFFSHYPLILLTFSGSAGLNFEFSPNIQSKTSRNPSFSFTRFGNCCF